MSKHPARRSLQRDVLPYIVTGRRLKQQWFYRAHLVFGYTTDLVVALMAAGISTPALALLAAGGAAEDAPESATIQSALADVPSWLYAPTLLLLVTWIFLRVTFTREEGQKRAVLAKSCTQVLRQAEASLHTVLLKPDPMPDLTELLEKKIRPSVDRNIQESAWPWLPFAPDIDQEVTKECDRLCARYESDWTPVPADTQDIRSVADRG
jgi:hypothetical protein